jgi:hypothetical protein
MITAGFTTRHGGISKPPFDSLNLGTITPDEPAAVSENLKIFHHHIDTMPEKTAFMHQVHGTDVITVNDGGFYDAVDGIITSEPGLALCVRVADCVPLLLYDPAENIIGAIHCGWRSLTGGIAEKAISLAGEKFGCTPDTFIAAIGPSAGVCCYEIGGEVVGRLQPESLSYREGKVYGNLKHELRQRLINVGVRKNNIETIGHCTICMEDTYFSYRRDGENSGRMLGYIKMKHG